jgi:hypothetical protein
MVFEIVTHVLISASSSYRTPQAPLAQVPAAQFQPPNRAA